MLGVATLLMAGGVARAEEPSIPNLYVTATDFQNNFPATDRFWYFRTETGNYITEGGQHPAIEFDANRVAEPGKVIPPVQGVVYPKNGFITVRLRIKNENNTAVNVSLKECGGSITADEFPYALELFPFAASDTTTIPANSDSTWIHFELMTAPYCVNLGNFSLWSRFYAKFVDESPEALPKVNPFSAATCRFYTVDSAPVGLQAVPWTDFLELSCKWAQWQEDEWDVSARAAHGIRHSTHVGGKLVYNPELGFYTVPATGLFTEYSNTIPPSYQYRVKLATFLSQVHLPQDIQMDCRDFAACMWLARQSQGYSGTQIVLAAASGPGFSTNLIAPAPEPALFFPGSYDTKEFAFHSVATDGEHKIFDASNSYDLDLNGAIHRAEVAWWDFPGYWQTWIEANHDMVGLANGPTENDSGPVPYAFGSVTPVAIVPGPESNE